MYTFTKIILTWENYVSFGNFQSHLEKLYIDFDSNVISYFHNKLIFYDEICFAVIFSEWNEWKNQQFNLLCLNLI